MLDGVAEGSAATMCGARGLIFDAALTLPPVLALVAQPGPALGMGSEARIAECAKAGFSWFAGDFALHPHHDSNLGDGTRASACWRCWACWRAMPIRASWKCCSSRIRRWPTTC
jgi:hypothetical protein